MGSSELKGLINIGSSVDTSARADEGEAESMCIGASSTCNTGRVNHAPPLRSQERTKTVVAGRLCF